VNNRNTVIAPRRKLPTRRRGVALSSATVAAAAAATIASLPAWAEVSANSSGSAQQNGIGNAAVTISMSGSTAMRNFTTSPFITLLTPGTSITINDGPGGTPVVYTAPNVSNASFQLASPNFTAADVPVGGPFPSTNTTQVHSALRFEWHEQGSVEGILDMANDQIGYFGGATGTAIIDLGTRNPTGGNPIWVNQRSYSAPANTNGLSLQTSSYNTYLNYDASGRNLQGGQNRVQMAISDVNARQGFAIGGTAATGSLSLTPGLVGYGKGNNTHGLTFQGALGTSSAAVAGAFYQLNDQTVLNMETNKPDPATGANYAAGPWNSGGVNNLDNHAVAVTATLFVANPGTGLDKVNRTDAQWLETTGRFSNGAAFNMTTRDVGSGTRNVAALNTGVDPTFAVGVNDDGNGNELVAGHAAADQSNIGPAQRFSNKTAGGGQLRPTVQNNRMAVGTLSMSDALGSVQNSATPLRALDYSDSTDGSSGYVRASASSITDGSYVIWQNETYVTVKAPNVAFAGVSGTAWANLTDADTGIKGDNAGSNVAAFRANILSSVSAFPNTSSLSNPADGLLNKSFILPQMMQKAKAVDGIGTTIANPSYNGTLRGQFLASVYANNFAPLDPTTITTGAAGATYGKGGNNTASFNGQITLTSQNYLFGNFNQLGVRDFNALKSAQAAQAALAASGAGTSMFTAAGGSANSTLITTGISALDTMNSGGNATKGDLIVMGDLNGDGVFDGKDLYLFARGAALADSTAGGTSGGALTVGGGETLGDALRRGVLRKNDALDWLQANATAQQKIDASANVAVDPSGSNAFNKFDINRDGRVSRNDAAIVNKFIGADKTNIANQLAATINVDGSVNAGTQKPVSLYDVGLIDGQNLISTGNYTGTGTSVTVTTPGDFALIRQALGVHLQPGDTRFRGQVDFSDLNQIVSNGHYNDGTSNNKWSDGDFTGDGKVNFSDINAIVSAGVYLIGNYDGGSPSAVKATPTLTGTKHGATPSTTTVGVSGDGLPDFRYDSSTGDVTFIRDGFDATKKIRTLTLLSAGSKFITGVGLASQNLSGFDIDQANQQSIARFGGNGITTPTLDLGNILPTNLTIPQLTSDLTVYFNFDGSGATDPNGVPANILVPEPTAAMSLVAIGLAGCLTRRRRRARA
jgi:hypothetical protein